VRGKFLSRRSEGLATSAGRPLRLAPENWRELDKTPIEKRLLDLP